MTPRSRKPSSVVEQAWDVYESKAYKKPQALLAHVHALG